jgi:hypothetical protein
MFIYIAALSIELTENIMKDFLSLENFLNFGFGYL